MLRPTVSPFLLLFVSAGLAGAFPASSQGPELVLDINPNFGDSSLNPEDVVPIGTISLFNGLTPETGRELWVTDGTSVGTEPLIDIVPGPEDGITSGGFDPVEMGGELFFYAGPSNARGLWATDGTAPGTREVKSFASGSIGISAILGATSTTVFFCANDGVNGTELWTSDGTEAGTALLLDIAPGTSNGCNASSGGIVIDSTLYFAGSNTNGIELWSSDGTAGGTAEVADIDAGPGDSTPNAFMQFGSEVVFRAFVGGTTQLIRSDGSALGTVQIPAPAGGSGPVPQIVFDGSLFFSAFDGTTGLFKTDGTTTTRLQDSLGMDFNVNSSVTPVVFNNRLFFSAGYGGFATYEPWRSTGASSGTGEFADLETGVFGSEPQAFAAIDGRLFFTADTTGFGRELWITNGTTTTQMVTDLNGTADDSIPSSINIVPVGNTNLALFEAVTAQGAELWRSDGTAGATQRLTDVVAHESSNPRGFQSWNDGVAYVYNHVAAGFSDTESRLGESDGTAAGTDELSSLGGTPNRAGATGLAGTSVVVLADTASTLDLWRGSFLGSVLVSDVPGDELPQRARSANGRFVWLNTVGPDRLYVSDGATTETAADAEIAEPCNVSSDNESFELIGDLLLYADESNCRPWALNLDTGTSLELSDMGSTLDGPDPVFFATTGSRALFFGGPTFSPADGQLWATDGTVAGTFALPLTFDPDTATLDQPGAPGPDGHYFLAETGGETQVWKSDGTAAGTSMAWTAPPGESDIQFATASGNTPEGVFWSGTSGVWHSDGTVPGTSLVTAITELPSLELVASWNDTLIVTAHRDGFGIEMAAVLSNGSIYWLDEIQPGGLGTAVGEAFVAGDTLFFAAFRADIGTELFKVELDQIPFFADGFESGDVTAWQ